MAKRQLIELDFLFIYEHKVRELENLCLLKYELDKRGYKTKIMHIEDEEALTAMRPIYHTKVVVMMACYQNLSIVWHTKRFVKFDKIIDMQWENIVFPMDEKNEKAFKSYSGVAKDVVRVSWGEMNRRRMADVVKMDPRKIKLVGHVGMDFLRDELKGYYLSKEEFVKDYGISQDQKIFLFVSPYFSDALPEDYVDELCRRFGEGWRSYYKDCMLPSKKIVLGWIRKVCEKREDILFVYRPHPGEESSIAGEMEKTLPNFRVIGDKSVKQWILVSDKIYTGNSSTFVEAYFAKKMCYLLFPIPVPKDYELFFFEEAYKICDMEQFMESTKEDCSIPFPVSEKLIDEVYSVDWNKPSYLKFADMAEEVIKNPYYALTKEQLSSYKPKQSFAGKVVDWLTMLTPIYDVYLNLLDNHKITWGWLEKKRAMRRQLTTIAHDFEKTSDEEVASIVAKIAKQLDK